MVDAIIAWRSRGAVPLFDSSALFAGVVSADGAARALLLLAEAGLLTLVVSEQVIAETERALARNAPLALPCYREALRSTRLIIVRDPPPADVRAHLDLITHKADVPILLAVMRAGIELLVTLNRRHFVDDSLVAEHSGLRIGTPGDALAWARARLTGAY